MASRLTFDIHNLHFKFELFISCYSFMEIEDRYFVTLEFGIVLSWHWQSYASRSRPWPRHLYRLWRLYEVTRHQDRLYLLRRTASATKHSTIRHQIRFPVVGIVTRFVTAGSWKCNPCRHSAVPAQASPVGNELRCSADVPIVEVRSHHSAPSRTSLVEGGGEDWLEACCPCLQVSAGSSTVVSCCRKPADFEARCRLRSASSSSLVIRRTRLSTVGNRAFPVAVAPVWNSLPQHVTSAQSLPVFHSCRKTHIFRRCFLWLCCCTWEVTLSYWDT